MQPAPGTSNRRLRYRNRALMPGHCRCHCCCLCLYLYLCFCRFLVPWRISLRSVSLARSPAVPSSPCRWPFSRGRPYGSSSRATSRLCPSFFFALSTTRPPRSEFALSPGPHRPGALARTARPSRGLLRFFLIPLPTRSGDHRRPRQFSMVGERFKNSEYC